MKTSEPSNKLLDLILLLKEQEPQKFGEILNQCDKTLIEELVHSDIFADNPWVMGDIFTHEECKAIYKALAENEIFSKDFTLYKAYDSLFKHPASLVYFESFKEGYQNQSDSEEEMEVLALINQLRESDPREYEDILKTVSRESLLNFLKSTFFKKEDWLISLQWKGLYSALGANNTVGKLRFYHLFRQLFSNSQHLVYFNDFYRNYPNKKGLLKEYYWLKGHENVLYGLCGSGLEIGHQIVLNILAEISEDLRLDLFMLNENLSPGKESVHVKDHTLTRGNNHLFPLAMKDFSIFMEIIRTFSEADREKVLDYISGIFIETIFEIPLDENRRPIHPLAKELQKKLDTCERVLASFPCGTQERIECLLKWSTPTHFKQYPRLALLILRMTSGNPDLLQAWEKLQTLSHLTPKNSKSQRWFGNKHRELTPRTPIDSLKDQCAEAIEGYVLTDNEREFVVNLYLTTQQKINSQFVPKTPDIPTVRRAFTR